MPALSISALINSVITFWQQIGMTFDVTTMNLPTKVNNVITGMVYLFDYILKLLPAVPDFDLRGNLVILSVGVPIVIDLIFVWFLNPLWETVLHIVGVIACFLFTYSISTAAFGKMETFHIIALSISAVFLVVRVILFIVFKKPKKMTQI